MVEMENLERKPLLLGEFTTACLSSAVVQIAISKGKK